MGKTCSDEKRIFHVITTAERKVERILLQLLRTDKNGMLGILQEEVLGKRSGDVLNALFVQWKGDITTISRDIFTILRDAEMEYHAEQVIN